MPTSLSCSDNCYFVQLIDARCVHVCVYACFPFLQVIACVLMSFYRCFGLEFFYPLFLSLSFSLSHTLLRTCTNVQPLLTVGLAKLLSEQMTKTKMVTSFLPTSPMFCVMVHINHTKLPCTRGSLFFLSLPQTGPLSTSSANGALFRADGFLMAKLEHTADGSLHLLQPAMQLMAVLMTKAVGVCNSRNQ